MPKRKVNEDVLAQIHRLKGRGEKDSEIAHKLGLDPRTVRSALSRIGKVMDYDHWVAVSRQVDSVLLQGHYNDLLLLAISIQEQLHRDLTGLTTSLPSFRSDRSIESALSVLFQEKLSNEATDQIAGATQGNLLHKVPWYRRQALANRLLKGMWDHEPELQNASDKWYQAFDKFQELKGNLWRETEFALKKELLAEAMLQQTIPIMIEELYENALYGSGAGAFDTHKHPNESQVYVYRKVGRSEHKFLLRSEEEVQGFCQLYESVLGSFVQSLKLKSSLVAANELPQLKEHADAIVDTMLLRGRPNGRCDLCPFASKSESGDR